MTQSPIMNVAVLGSGQMGAGIAQVAAQSAKNVHIYDTRPEALIKAKEGIQKSLEKLEAKKIIQEKAADVLNRIKFVERLVDIALADIVIEAVTESYQVKSDLFKQVEEVVKAETILASNTSSISITKIASCLKNPSRFIGMHFMNPVPIMKLVEVIPGLATSEETKTNVLALASEMGKVTVESRDMPGFIVNRILMPMINEACFALQENLATAKDIDEAMKLGTNQPMGPLTLADFIGLDTCLYIMGVLHEGLGDSKYRPSPLLRQYVEAGWLGRKTGRGFYSY
ncbi:MAG: 3-hydroxyacyl-CoA dehydrogenase NAD-binding domain-containing protein [Bdellovibrionota bacterium]